MPLSLVITPNTMKPVSSAGNLDTFMSTILSTNALPVSKPPLAIFRLAALLEDIHLPDKHLLPRPQVEDLLIASNVLLVWSP